MTPAEYVEQLVRDAYKREIDQEENVYRSLPFFATALGVLATAVVFARPTLPPLTLQVLPIAIYVVLVILGICAVVAIALLLAAVWPRNIKIPMAENELVGYADSLVDFYKEASQKPAEENGAPREPVDSATVDKAVIDDLRDAITGQLATAAGDSRKVNKLRLVLRGYAAVALFAAILCAFSMLALILVHDIVDGRACHERYQSAGSGASRAAGSDHTHGAHCSQTGSAANAGSNPGRMDV